ncbi:MAG: M28 family peptidase [Gemmatimonadales bacterium]|nr:M28 family peptidase [Gemmatimonadales bacterium]
MRVAGWIAAWVLAVPVSDAAGQATVESALRRDVQVLSADSLGGRFTGSPGGDAAARYLAWRFEEAGAKPAPGGWLHEFTMPADLAGFRSLPPDRRPTRAANVVALVPGTDPELQNEYVVVGAHYDHLGDGHANSLGTPGEIHNGADDNASGTAALLDIARRFAAAPAKRTVVLVAFSGEEFGLLGSAAYVRSAPVSMERTVAMVNLDMVGRLRNDRLLVFGSETATEFPAMLDSLNGTHRFDLHYSGDGFGRSDQQSFYLARKPVLHMFTDLHEDYHRPSDDWDKINLPGLVRVAAYTTDVVRAIADRRTPLTFVMGAPPAHSGAAAAPVSAGYGAYLGSIPDMGSGGPGVRLSGVRPGSPADQAGLAEGDVLLRIGDFEIADLQAMTDALRSYKPGESAVVRYRRGADERSTTVVFGRRGG